MRTAKTVFVKNFGNVQVVRQDSPGDVFFDIFGEDGRCLNVNKPFWTEPSDEEVRQCLSSAACLKQNRSSGVARASA